MPKPEQVEDNVALAMVDNYLSDFFFDKQVVIIHSTFLFYGFYFKVLKASRVRSLNELFPSMEEGSAKGKKFVKLQASTLSSLNILPGNCDEKVFSTLFSYSAFFIILLL